MCCAVEYQIFWASCSLLEKRLLILLALPIFQSIRRFYLHLITLKTSPHPCENKQDHKIYEKDIFSFLKLWCRYEIWPCITKSKVTELPPPQVIDRWRASMLTTITLHSNHRHPSCLQSYSVTLITSLCDDGANLNLKRVEVDLNLLNTRRKILIIHPDSWYVHDYAQLSNCYVLSIVLQTAGDLFFKKIFG